MSTLIDATVHSVKRIISELRPRLLDDFGLLAAIEYHSEEFVKRIGIRCDIESTPENIILDEARSVAVFRIFQETLTNIARHAGATCVRVSLNRNSSIVEMKVSDNGKGISKSQLLRPQSAMIATGKTVTEIGDELLLSVKTISTNRARALKKMNMKNNAEFTYYAIKQGLVV